MRRLQNAKIIIANAKKAEVSDGSWAAAGEVQQLPPTGRDGAPAQPGRGLACSIAADASCFILAPGRSRLRR